MDEGELSNVLTALYAALFSEMSDSSKLCNALRPHLKLEPAIGEQWLKVPLVHHGVNSCLSFVALLHLAMENITTNWRSCLRTVVNRIEALEKQHFMQKLSQELRIYLYSYNLGLALDNEPLLAPRDSLQSAHLPLGLSRLHPLPPTMYITLVLPLNHLERLSTVKPEAMDSPGLRISICNTNLKETQKFVLLQCLYGSLESDPSDDSLFAIKEEQLGAKNTSDLIVSCLIPTHVLLAQSADDINISLALNNNSHNQALQQTLGPRLILCDYDMADAEKVRFSKDVPVGRSSKDPSIDSLPAQRTFEARSSPVSACAQKTPLIKSLCVHAEFSTDSTISQLIVKGAKMSVFQSGPCSMTL